MAWAHTATRTSAGRNRVVTILKRLGRTRTVDDCGVGKIDGGGSKYAENAVAEVDVG